VSNLIRKLTTYGSSALITAMALTNSAYADPGHSPWWWGWRNAPVRDAPELTASGLLVAVAIAVSAGLIYAERRRSRRTSINN